MSNCQEIYFGHYLYETFLQKSEFFFFFPFKNDEALLSEMQCSIGTVMILMTAFTFISDLKINQVLHIYLNIKSKDV